MYPCNKTISLSLVTKYNKKSQSKAIWEELHCHPSWQRITMPQSPHWLQWDASHLSPKLPFHSTITTHLMHPSLDRPHLSPQMASRSNQPFHHSTCSRQIDRWARQQVCIKTCLCSIYQL